MDWTPREPPEAPPCKGYWTHTTDGSDFGCEYMPDFVCEECIVNGGKKDPRTKKHIDFEDGGAR